MDELENIEIDQGERLDLLVEDDEASYVQLLVFADVDSTEPLLPITDFNFEDGKAQITYLYEDTSLIAPGDYVAQIRLFDEDGEFWNLRDEDCDSDDGECEFIVFKVCPSLGESESS